MATTGTCKLCLTNGELRESHILSELLYKPAYDAIHRAIEMKIGSGRRRVIQKGYREAMLCGKCEGFLSKFENYFADQWVKQGKLPATLSDPVIEIKGLDYAPFKLFHLSVIWRASVSQRDEFRNVKLGPHEEVIRTLLLNEDPGDPTLYPFWGRILFDPTDRRVTDDVIVEPEMYRVDSHYVYIFTFGGCAWYYIVSSHDPRSLVPVLFRPGKSLVLVAQDLYSYPPLAEFARRCREARGSTRRN